MGWHDEERDGAATLEGSRAAVLTKTFCFDESIRSLVFKEKEMKVLFEISINTQEAMRYPVICAQIKAPGICNTLSFSPACNARGSRRNVDAPASKEPFDKTKLW